jgi:hypothetical protein
MSTATTLADLQENWSQDILDTGDEARTDINSLFDNYTTTQGVDADWALDWSRPDSAYSSSGEVSEPAATPEASSGPLQAGIAKEIKHHIMTNKNFKAGMQWSRKYINLFKQNGIGKKAAVALMNCEQNIAKLETTLQKEMHKGRGHVFEYHQWVFDRIMGALERERKRLGDLSSGDAIKAVKNELAALEEEILAHPERLKGILR